MVRFKQLSVLLVGLSVTVGCVFGSTVAFAGAQGAGGGMSSGRKIADAQDIVEAIADSKLALRIALDQMLQTSFNIDPHSDSVLRSILYKPHLFKDLAQLKIHPQVAPCSYDHLKRDASIHGNDVCMSTGQLNKYAYSQNEILRKVTGLLGHEFAHRRGITFQHDSDADIMRNQVEALVPLVAPATYAFNLSDNYIISAFSDIDRAYDTFRLDTTLGLPQACAAAASVVANINGADDELSNLYGYAGPSMTNILPPRLANTFQAAEIRAGLILFTGCGLTPAPTDRGELAVLKTLSHVSQRINMYDLFYNIMIQGSHIMKNPPESQTGYERNTCGMAPANSDCYGQKSTYFSKLPFGDIAAMKQQMFEAKTELTQVEGEMFQIIAEAHRLTNRFNHPCYEPTLGSTKTCGIIVPNLPAPSGP